MATGPSERQRALALLRDQHTFPGEFSFRVVIRPQRRSAIVSAVVATLDAGAGGAEALVEVTERPSRNGTYLALHLTTRLAAAESVLEIYEVIRAVDGVITVM